MHPLSVADGTGIKELNTDGMADIQIYNKLKEMGMMSRPKPSCDWHPHLPSYVSEPTNLNLNISM